MPSIARRSIGVTIDATTREATVRGHAVALTNQELDLLVVLTSAAGLTWTRELLMETAWRDDSYVTVATVDVVVAALRRKIERDPRDPRFVLGGAELGYRFVDVE
jgi:two-component system torCAD operon response regulator TorR